MHTSAVLGLSSHSRKELFWGVSLEFLKVHGGVLFGFGVVVFFFLVGA